MPETRFAHAMERILQAAARPRLLVSALSGGMDSVTLLHLLTTWTRSGRAAGIRIVAAHLNHCLRGEEADGDEAFCRRLARSHDIPFVCRRADAAAHSRAAGLGIEAAGRELRYRFFAELAGENGLALTGHHADDQAETVLLHLRRGAHRRGLAGMRELTRLPAGPGGKVTLGRPLLGIDRDELERYARRHRLAWREDNSNRDTAFLRNRIRHAILPGLERLMPGFRRNLLRRAARAGEMEAQWEERTLLHLERAGTREYGGRIVPLDDLPADPEAALYLLRRVVEEETGGRVRDRASLERLLALAERGATGHGVTLAGGLLARRETDGIFFTTGAGTGHATPRVLPRPPFALETEDMRITAEWRPGRSVPPEEDRADPEVAWFDAASLRPPIVLRPPLPGERFHPLNARGSRKIQDMLVDGKIPRRARGAARVLADMEGALWLWPLRVCHRASLTGGTAGALRMTMRRRLAQEEMAAGFSTACGIGGGRSAVPAEGEKEGGDREN